MELFLFGRKAKMQIKIQNVFQVINFTSGKGGDNIVKPIWKFWWKVELSQNIIYLQTKLVEVRVTILTKLW